MAIKQIDNSGLTRALATLQLISDEFAVGVDDFDDVFAQRRAGCIATDRLAIELKRKEEARADERWERERAEYRASLSEQINFNKPEGGNHGKSSI